MLRKILLLTKANLYNSRWVLANYAERECLMFDTKKEALKHLEYNVSKSDRVGWWLYKYHPAKQTKESHRGFNGKEE